MAIRSFINTTGLGVIPSSVDIGPHRLTPGDRIIVSGNLGAHGMAVLSQREGLEFSGGLCQRFRSSSHRHC